MTQTQMLQFLLRDTGAVPCSRYGTDSESCAPVAVAVAVIVENETGDPMDKDWLDRIMGLVVNNHDDPEYLIRTYGPLHGINPSDYLHMEGE